MDQLTLASSQNNIIENENQPLISQRDDLLSRSLIYKLVFLAILSISLCAMGSFIVLEGDSFPDQQFLIVLFYNLFFCLLFGLTLFFYYKLTIKELIQCCSFHETSLIGLFWSMNYVFILIANPFIPNTIQTIMAQSQNALIAIIDYKYIGIKLSLLKWLLIFLNVLGNVIGIVSATNTSSESTSVIVFWSLVFLLNALASGMASLASEVLLKLKKNFYSDNKDDLQRIIELNFGSNFYGFIFDFFGVMLSYTANHDHASVWNFTILGNTEIFFFYGMLFSSFFYTIISYHAIVLESAIFNAMCSAFGSTMQVILFTFTFMGKYQSIPDNYGITACVITNVASIGFILSKTNRNLQEMRNSFIGVYYDKILQGDKGITYKYLFYFTTIYFVYYFYAAFIE
jgi:hypothetical protein